jgi:hypothetical protein
MPYPFQGFASLTPAQCLKSRRGVSPRSCHLTYWKKICAALTGLDVICDPVPRLGCSVPRFQRFRCKGPEEFTVGNLLLRMILDKKGDE